MNNHSDNGAKVYTPLTLKLYDWWVLNISNQFAWKCPTEQYLLPHFLKNLGHKHLDIGVGTGYYLTHAPSDCKISLMDLNTASLNAASARAREPQIIHKINHDVFEPYPVHLNNHFDSISMFYLLHCLPGTMPDKDIVIENAKMALTNGGVLYGATILGEGIKHNSFSAKLMHIYNRKGIFSNRQDSKEELERILSNHFHKVDITVKGAVALFSASKNIII
ncbi:class I SAM-dependent methyltransferase [Enterobacter sp. WCHEn045836]|uniref:class I SAM-dependent methyltransferase n=1 Tax=Enterobacter sp. WCHEn045836 TaxID=2497434 RepID=UPI000F82327E|nr:class I SAM-dependent methyltransferase [Enterobacter sp. WCHEn045836]RTP93722.1 class I SAM-dependent methyltransferase [Enterobacter sp. WCHEn045836]